MKDRIKKLMDSRNMTQQSFAQMLGINPASLSQVLSGRSNPTLNHVEAIKNCFPEISYDWLIRGNGDMFAGNDGEGTAPAAAQKEPTLFDFRQETVEKKETAPSVEKVVLERNIKEIVIYYDNNTFETFVPKNREK